MTIMLLALVATGCSDDEPAQPVPPCQVGFEAEARQNGPTTTLNITDFKVTAYRQNEWGYEMLMDNVTVTRTGLNSWEYSPPVDWPVGETVDFYAVSPAWVTMNNNAWWEHIIPFSARDDVSTDLLVAVRTDVNQTSGRLKLNFRHAMARVNIRLRCNLPGRTARVKAIWLNNYADYGNFQYPHVTTAPDTGIGELYDCWQVYNTTNTRIELWRSADGYLALGSEPQTVCSDCYFIPFTLKSGTDHPGWEATLFDVLYQVVDTETGEQVWPTVDFPHSHRRGRSRDSRQPLGAGTELHIHHRRRHPGRMVTVIGGLTSGNMRCGRVLTTGGTMLRASSPPDCFFTFVD